MFHRFKKINKILSYLLVVIILLSTCLISQTNFSANAGSMRDVTALQLLSEVKIGVNIGNSLDSVGSSETAWGNPKITKEEIQKQMPKCNDYYKKKAKEEEKKRKAEEAKKAEEEKKRLEEERIRAEEARKAEEERKRLEAEKKAALSVEIDVVSEDKGELPFKAKEIIGFRGQALFSPLEFAKDIAQELSKTDIAYIMDIHPAREKQKDFPNITKNIGTINKIVPNY